jgi:hypothetical protein
MDIGVSDGVRGNFVSMFGAAMVVGGKMAGFQIQQLGRRGHTTLSNILTIAAFCTFGMVPVCHSLPPS